MGRQMDDRTLWSDLPESEWDDFLDYVPKGADFNTVDNPSHYGQGTIEAIEYIEDFLTKEEYIGYLRGNIAKYMHRFRYKNGVEDLKKARWYLNALINAYSGHDDIVSF